MHDWIRKSLISPGEIRGVRELARRLNALRLAGDPSFDLRNAVIARKCNAFMKRLKGTVSATLYCGFGHSGLFEHLQDHGLQKRILQRYSAQLAEYVDPRLSENVIYLKYNPKTQKYDPDVIKLHGVLQP